MKHPHESADRIKVLTRLTRCLCLVLLMLGSSQPPAHALMVGESSDGGGGGEGASGGNSQRSPSAVLSINEIVQQGILVEDGGALYRFPPGMPVVGILGDIRWEFSSSRLAPQNARLPIVTVKSVSALPDEQEFKRQYVPKEHKAFLAFSRDGALKVSLDVSASPSIKQLVSEVQRLDGRLLDQQATIGILTQKVDSLARAQVEEKVGNARLTGYLSGIFSVLGIGAFVGGLGWIFRRWIGGSRTPVSGDVGSREEARPLRVF